MSSTNATPASAGEVTLPMLMVLLKDTCETLSTSIQQLERYARTQGPNADHLRGMEEVLWQAQQRIHRWQSTAITLGGLLLVTMAGWLLCLIGVMPL
jgi:hypothetical protein